MINYTMKKEIQNKKIPAEVYSRVSGYFRPVYTNGRSGQWNKGKQEEFKERQKIKVPDNLIYRASTRNFSEKEKVTV